MALIEWFYRLLFGEDAADDLRQKPKRRRK